MFALRYPLALVGALAIGAIVPIPAQAATSVWDRVAACESSGNWSINTGNGYFGGVQFTHSTWLAYGGGRYASNANLASKNQQIEIAQKVLVGQGPGAWPMCGVRAGLTRSNGSVTVSRSLVRAPLTPPITSRALVVKIQRWVGVRQDGAFGLATRKALQRRVGARPDGVIGPATMAKLQLKIGMHRDGAKSMNARTLIFLAGHLK